MSLAQQYAAAVTEARALAKRAKELPETDEEYHVGDVIEWFKEMHDGAVLTYVAVLIETAGGHRLWYLTGAAGSRNDVRLPWTELVIRHLLDTRVKSIWRVTAWKQEF